MDGAASVGFVPRDRLSRGSRPWRSWWLGVAGAACAAAVLGAGLGQAACNPGICVASPPTAPTCTIAGGIYTIDDQCVLNFPPDKTVIVDRTATLQTGSLGFSYTINAKAVSVRGGVLKAHGGTLSINTTDGFELVTVDNAGRLDAQHGGLIAIDAGGDVTLGGVEVTADGGVAGNGGTIRVIGDDITVTAPVHADGTGGRGGEIGLVAAGAISIGANVSANAATSPGPARGGRITADAWGTLSVNANLLADGNNDGDGGVIGLKAGGASTLGGTYSANGTGGGAYANGGRISVEASSVTASGTWTANGNVAGEGGDIYVRASTGAITTMVTSSMRANGGSGGGDGGSVELVAKTHATLAGNVIATAGGSGSTGGEISVEAGGTLNVSNTLEARSTATNGEHNGTIRLRGCDVVVSGALRTNNPAGAGNNLIQYVNSLNASGATLQADSDTTDDGGNAIYCGCVDANADGACDSPATCLQAPILSGATITPAQTLTPAAPSSCS